MLCIVRLINSVVLRTVIIFADQRVNFFSHVTCLKEIQFIGFSVAEDPQKWNLQISRTLKFPWVEMI